MDVFNIPVGGKAKITSVDAAGVEGARLRSLGIVRGAEIRLLAFSLFKSAALVSVNGARVSIRRRLAARIKVE